MKNFEEDKNKGYIVVVAVTLVLVFSVFIAYYVISSAPPEGYATIYVLDLQKRAVDYPELVVINQNNTFSVWVGVENHMGKSESFEVLLKVTNDTSPAFPAEVQPSNSFAATVEEGEKWETLSTITIPQPGAYAVIFELWIYDDDIAQNVFSGKAVVLNVEAVNQT
jgi:uncharacterized membrane protein